jgi:hypothetical protein
VIVERNSDGQRLSETIRLAAFEAAARERIPGMIFTFVDSPPAPRRHGGPSTA